MPVALPVLVVGAGPTGLALATELRRAGVACRVVDRAADRPAHQARALTVWPGALDVLDRHGIATDVVAAGLTLAATKFFSDGKLLATVRFGGGRPVPVCEPQPALERIQRARLAELGVEVEWGTELIGLRDTGDAVDVVLDGPSGQELVTAAWVAGCDGANSRVRDLAGIRFAGKTYPRSFILGDGDIVGDLPRDEVHYTLHGDGVLVVVPLPGGGLRVFADVTRMPGAEDVDPDAPLSTEQLQTLADQRAPYPLQVRDLIWSTRFQVHLRRAERYRAGRVLLAGDAAHIHSPAGGQGMNTGIQDGAGLGWRLALITRGVAAEDRLLAGYEAERAPVAKQVMRSSDQQTRLWGMRSVLVRRIRDRVLARMGRTGFLEQKVMPAMAQDDLDYSASPGVGSNGGRRALGVGVADVEVRPVGAVSPVSLRSLLTGPAHTLLLWADPADLAPVRAVLDAAAPLGDRLQVRVLVPSAAAPALTEGTAVAAAAVVVPDGHAPHGPLAGCRSVLVRPDGYVAGAAPGLDVTGLLAPLLPAPVPAPAAGPVGP
ncbi:FAD-dependent monooxygenase [Pseudonocardia sp. MH-G8]|uniref:FAD-dependent monooxygenase n=1 Tax=Pseudonocardia sp. MH-G8 TaxID=1854588 RepID=UPI0013042DED|nr:FAD-dependent monooxygenase [Pseudonocardia sp. MH-G8]